MITYRDGSLSIKTPYSVAFVEALKRNVPASKRKWDALSKAWIVAPEYGNQVVALIEMHYQTKVELPKIEKVSAIVKGRLVELRYLSLIKDRYDMTRSAYGFSNGDWNLVFDEAVLEEFFDGHQDKSKPKNESLYQVLLIKSDASAEDIRIAHRRMAKILHPDVNKEENAPEMFRKIQAAYELLKDDTKRRKYDAGLRMLAMSGKVAETKQYDDFQSPLRCGNLIVNGEMRIGRLYVTAIHDWRDIVNASGQTLVTSWPRGAKTFIESWA